MKLFLAIALLQVQIHGGTGHLQGTTNLRRIIEGSEAVDFNDVERDLQQETASPTMPPTLPTASLPPPTSSPTSMPIASPTSPPTPAPLPTLPPTSPPTSAPVPPTPAPTDKPTSPPTLVPTPAPTPRMPLGDLRLDYPYRTVGLVTNSGRPGLQCTGTLVGPNLVLTSQYCLNVDGNYTDMKFVPAFGPDSPFGEANVVGVEVAVSNVAFDNPSEKATDFAVLVLQQSVGEEVGYMTVKEFKDPKWLGWEGFHYIGYPAEDFQTPIMFSNSSVTGFETHSQFPTCYVLECDVGVSDDGIGERGGPLFEGNNVVGVYAGETFWAGGEKLVEIVSSLNQQQAPTGDDKRKIYPYSAVGLLWQGDGPPVDNVTCTGTMVGPNIVVTSQYCINTNFYDLENLAFIPAYGGCGIDFATNNTDCYPFGFSGIESVKFGKGTENYDSLRDIAYDFGIVTLKDPLGEKTGWMGVEEFQDDWLNIAAFDYFGYPLTNNSGPDFYVDNAVTGITYTEKDAFRVYVLTSNVGAEAGERGGPLYMGNTIVAVKSFNYTYLSDTDENANSTDLLLVDDWAGGYKFVDVVNDAVGGPKL